MKYMIPWDLIASVVIAIIGSSWFANWVQSKSKYSNRAILEEVQANAADISRRRVLTFDSEIRKGEKHTKEDFNDVITDIDKYDEYCATHPNYKNTRSVIAESHIKKVYEQCLETDDFL